MPENLPDAVCKVHFALKERVENLKFDIGKGRGCVPSVAGDIHLEVSG